MITWNIPIWLYLWLAGMAGGSFLAAFLAERFSREGNRRLIQTATYWGLPLVMIGLMLLVVDLGCPLRFWHLMTRFYIISPMSLGSWILLLWTTIAGVMVVIWLGRRYLSNYLSEERWLSLQRLADILTWPEAVLSALLISYTGVLLSTSNQPLWSSTWILPFLFAVSATSTGVALLVMSAPRDIPQKLIAKLSEADAILIIMELVVLIAFAIWLNGSSVESLRLLTIGVMAAPFWIGIIVVGLLLPLLLEMRSWGKEAGGLALRFIAGLLVILGGVILRAVIVIGGQL